MKKIDSFFKPTKKIFSILVLGCFLALNTPALSAQCPMCKLSAESDLKHGGRQAKGLNSGILYLLVCPYLLVGTIGYLWVRNRKKVEQHEEERALEELLAEADISLPK